jgi:fused signal recognition particle receptor
MHLSKEYSSVFGRLFGKKTEEKSEDDFKLEQSLQKTRTGIFGRISTIFQENQITDQLWEELEETLIMGDVGMLTTEELLNATRERVYNENIKSTSDAYLVLKQEMVRLLQSDDPLHIDEPRILTVVLVVGVNGSGKTTSIGKMAYYYKQRGRRVVLGAADTFRAAAIDQLKIWAERAM